MNNQRLHRAITPEADKTHAGGLVKKEQRISMTESDIQDNGLKKFGRRQCFIFFFLAVLISGCATIKGDIENPQFVQENLPVRNLSICLITDEGIPLEKATALIRETSSYMEAQVGITLKTTVRLTNSDKWPSKKRSDMLGHVYVLSKSCRNDFDICVCIYQPTTSEKIKKGLIGGWNGVIDDIYRRYIVIKKMDSRTLLHEMYHAFIFSHKHSGSGIMQASLISIIPFVSIYLNSSTDLSPSDRKEVLENKWRNFNDPVSVKSVLEEIMDENP